MRLGYLVVGMLLLTVVSCGGNQTEAREKEPEIKEVKKDRDVHPDEDVPQVVQNEEVEIPAFEVEVELSDRAKKKLEQSGEMITVDAMFSGELKSTSKLEVSDDGQFYLANASREIMPGQIAKFNKIMVPQNVIDDLKKKDYEVGINVYTSRKVFANNILSSLGAFGKISEFKGKRITIEVKLIEE